MGEVATKKINGEIYNNTGYLGRKSTDKESPMWKKIGEKLLTYPQLEKEAKRMEKISGRKTRVVKETSKMWGTIYRVWIKSH